MTCKSIFPLIGVICIGITSCKKDETPRQDLVVTAIYVGTTSIDLNGNVTSGLPVDQLITISFSIPVNVNSAATAFSVSEGSQDIGFDISFQNNNKSILIQPVQPLAFNTQYTITVSDQLQGGGKENFSGLQVDFKTIAGTLTIASMQIGGQTITGSSRVDDVPLDFEANIEFSAALDPNSITGNVQLTGPDQSNLSFAYSNNNKTLIITRSTPLAYLTKYTLTVTNTVKGEEGERFSGTSQTFYSAVDETPKFPLISDDELLNKVQLQTFKYFWDFAHPASGLARERNSSGDVVTIGGSGFGLMAIIVGIERGFITRSEGITRLTRIVDFLANADRFHGAWPHWMNGQTGKVVPFSTKDDGGDLVETAYLIQGLLTVRAYLDPNVSGESELINKITGLWESVEWTWYTREGQNVLYWHWSPDYNWDMNMPVAGYNEALIVYVLAASSPTYPISKAVYTEGWAKNGDIVNGSTYYDYQLPLGQDYGGPLFFAHYSFLGLDPRNLQDQYADYWEQNVNHSLINQAYCAANPRDFVAYSDSCWGLTASDDKNGYDAHSPTNDNGTITPTAALSSFPYAPEQSMKALKYFYYTMGDRLWGPYGFYDAFNVTQQWYADSYLAIDQGPIVDMIENYRTGLLWDLFMADTDVQNGLNVLGFNY